MDFKHYLELASEGIHILDNEGNIIECSQSFADMLGYTYEDLKKLNLQDLDVKLGYKNILLIIEDPIDSSTIAETRYKCKDGSILDVQIHPHSF